MAVLRCASQLLVAVSKPHFDYSLVYAMVKWLVKALDQCLPPFIPVLSSSVKLSSTISFSSGVGLSQLWSQFLLMPQQDFSSEIIQLDAQNRNAATLEGKDSPCVRRKFDNDATLGRRRVFTLMSLHLTGNGETKVVDRLIHERLEVSSDNLSQFISWTRPQHCDFDNRAVDLKIGDRSILITELGVLAASQPSAVRVVVFLPLVGTSFYSSSH